MRSETIEQVQARLFGEIVKRLAHENGVPLAAGGAHEAIAEVEFAAEILLRQRRALMAVNSTGLAALVAEWRGLDQLRREAANSQTMVSMPAAA